MSYRTQISYLTIVLVNSSSKRRSITSMYGRSCLCHSTGCNGDWKSAESVPCYNCNSSDGIECDGEHHGEEVKCWHPQNRGCAISESELDKLISSYVHFYFSAVSSGSSVFVRSCSDEHEEDGFVCRCVCHVCWVCLTSLSVRFVSRVCLTGLSDRIVCAATQPWRTARGCMSASAQRRWETWLENLATSTGKLLGRTGQLTPLQNWR